MKQTLNFPEMLAYVREQIAGLGKKNKTELSCVLLVLRKIYFLKLLVIQNNMV